MTRRLAAVLVAALLGVAATAHAQDTDRTRFYLGLRGQDTNPGAGVHDAWGVSLGANLGKYWGVELSADAFERRVKGNDTEGVRRDFAEYGVVALVPQLRLRYPLLGARLVPYVVGGVGVGFTEINDRKRPAFGRSIRNDDSAVLLGTVGAGLEYFVADNIAIGAEVKYVLAGDATVRVDGAPRNQEIQAPLFAVGLRLLVPETTPASVAARERSTDVRVYLGARVGAAITTNRSGFDSLTIEPEPPAYFSEANQLFGAVVGVDLGRHWGIELVAEGYEVRLADSTGRSLTEAAIVTIIPHVRWRYPLLGGRVVPFVSAGVGLGHIELNDAKAPSNGRDIGGSTFGVAAAGGGGVEYFVASNISLGVDAKYQTTRGHTFRLDRRERDAHAEAVIAAFTLRAYLWSR